MKIRRSWKNRPRGILIKPTTSRFRDECDKRYTIKPIRLDRHISVLWNEGREFDSLSGWEEWSRVSTCFSSSKLNSYFYFSDERNNDGGPNFPSFPLAYDEGHRGGPQREKLHSISCLIRLRGNYSGNWKRFSVVLSAFVFPYFLSFSNCRTPSLK